MENKQNRYWTKFLLIDDRGIVITNNQIILSFVLQIRLKSDVTKNGCEKFLERKASGTL